MNKFISLEEYTTINTEASSKIPSDIPQVKTASQDDLIEATALRTGRRIEAVLRRKIDQGQDLTEEEAFIATEAISTLYGLTKEGFSGFGFEQYNGSELSAKEFSSIALEAVSNQNVDKAKSLKAKIENFKNSLSDYASWFSGNMDQIRDDAEKLLAKVKSLDEGAFSKNQITDKRVYKALVRAQPDKPFKSHKEVLASLSDLNDAVEVIGKAAKYTNIKAKEGSEYDLGDVSIKFKSKVIAKDENTVTYDLNPKTVGGMKINVTVPAHNKNNWIMRNISGAYNLGFFSTSTTASAKDFSIQALSKQECVQLLNDVIAHIDRVEKDFKSYYSNAKYGIAEVILFIPLLMLLVGMFSYIMRVFMQECITKIHYCNREVLRGLVAWVASSIKE